MNFVSAFRTQSLLQTLTLLALLPGMVLLPMGSYANPSGGTVVKGSAEIVQDIEGVLQVLQDSDKAVIEWEDFSIGIDELTQFLQPGSDSATLNRVTSGAVSQLMGDLKANGKVLVINPNGIVIGSEGSVDTAGFIASSLNVSDDEFMAGGDMVFKGDSDASVLNMGRIETKTGDVFLISRTVENRGEISAPEGTVGLAGGQEVLLLAVADSNGERIFVRPSGSDGQVTNAGAIEAATAELKAKGGLYQTAVNNEGSVTASRVVNKGGRIFLRAGSSMPNGGGRSGGGKVVNTGSLKATAGASGGEILIDSGNDVAQIGGMVDASGDVDGGKIEVIGNKVEIMAGAEINASGTTGQGGEIKLGEDGATEEIAMAQSANIQANGGTDGGLIRAEASGSIASSANLEAIGGTGEGGDIDVFGDEVNLGSGSVLRADGATGGGTVRVGGGFQGSDSSVRNSVYTTVEPGALLSADALEEGTGGEVIVWSDGDTVFEGTISAQNYGVGNGGMVEVSGKETLSYQGQVNTMAANGEFGTLLLDPADFTVTAGGVSGVNTISDADLITALGTSNVTIATDIASAGTGTITVEDAADVTWATNSSLSLVAFGDIDVEGRIWNQADGDVNLIAGWDGASFVTGSTSEQSGVEANVAAFRATPTSWGNVNAPAGGVVNIGLGTSTGQTWVGSEQGTTNVLGYEVNVRGSDSTVGGYAQLGTPAGTGDIFVDTKDGGLNLLGGSADGAYAQIGHGGNGDTASALSGDIRLNLAQGAAPGELDLTGGGVGSYAQIGHGTAGYTGAISASDILIYGATDTDDGAGLVDLNGGSVAGAFARIGHGGEASSANLEGNIIINASDQINVQSGNPANSVGSFTQIGHGGTQSTGTKDGNITLTSDSLFVQGRGAHGNYGMIGHGGDVSSGNIGSTTGDISVTTDGLIEVTGNQSGRRTAATQIGHGGYDAGNNGDTINGAITVISLTDSVEVTGSNGGSEQSYTQIGHGGQTEANGGLRQNMDYNATGDITVLAEAGTISLIGAGAQNHTQIGHGGERSRGDNAGAITLRALGDIVVEGGTNVNSTAQVGHGGSDTTGYNAGTDSYQGDITVISATGDITLEANGNNGTVAQIGHGGRNSNVDMSGNVLVEATTGSISIEGGSGSTSFAMIGHGGALLTSSGTRDGDIYINAGTAITTSTSGAPVGIGGISNSSVGATETALQAPTITIGGNPVIGGSTVAILPENTFTLTGDWIYNAATDLNIWSEADVNINAMLQNSGTGDLNLVAGWNGSTGINGGAGVGTFLNAGVPDFSIDFGALESDATAWGQNLSEITVEATGSSPVAVGSRAGNTNLLAYGANIVGSSTDADAYARVGYVPQLNTFSSLGGLSADYTQAAPGAFSFTDGAGTTTTFDGADFADGDASNESATFRMQVAALPDNSAGTSRLVLFESGGGTDGIGLALEPGNILNFTARGDTVPLSVDANAMGLVGQPLDIVVSVDVQNGPDSDVVSIYINGQFAGDMVGDIPGNDWAGGDAGAFGQVNGGYQTGGTSDPFPGAGGLADFEYFNRFAAAASPDTYGNISIQTQEGGLSLNAGAVDGAYAQIGHGGTIDPLARLSGDISMNLNRGAAAGDLALTAGGGVNSYAQIGHGAIGHLGTDGAIGASLNASGNSDILLHGASATDAGAGLVTLGGGSEEGAMALIGHGGVQSTATIANGDIILTSEGAMNLNGGSGLGAGAQVGHGGYLASNTVTDSDITLTTTDGSGAGIALQGGSEIGAYAQVGHGGYNESRDAAGTGIRTGWAEATRAGDIIITGDTAVTSIGGSAQGAFSQVGHGGRRNNAVDTEGHSGAISVTSRTGNIEFQSGSAAESYSMAGHGGYQTTGNHSGAISLTDANVDADRAFSQVGHGGYDADFNTAADISGSTSTGLNDINDLPFYVDNRAANLSGNISVTATNGLVRVEAVDANASHEGYAQIGHGGYDTMGSFGGAGETITVSAGDEVQVYGGQQGGADFESRSNYAQIGHGGVINNVENAVDEIAFNGGFYDPNATLLSGEGLVGGLEGISMNHEATITVDAVNRVNIDGGTDNLNYAMIGQGGVNNGDALVDGGHTGMISVSVTNGDVRLQGGAGGGFGSPAQIGHGGRNSDGEHNGSISVMASEDVVLDNSGSNDSYDQIGHGGINTDGDLGLLTDTLTVSAGNDILMETGGTTAYALIGNGGFDATGNYQLGTLSVTAENNLDMIPTAGGNDEFALIGLGGRAINGNHEINSILVDVGGNLTMTSGANSRNFTMIGVGGQGNNTVGPAGFYTVNQGITVDVDGDIAMTGGTSASFSQIGVGGHGTGSSADPANYSIGENLSVTAGGFINLTGGSNSAAMIGIGGINANLQGGAMTATQDILVEAGGDINLLGGASTGFAHIGIGGADSQADLSARDVTVESTAGAVTLQASDQNSDGYAHIGLGGHSSDGTKISNSVQVSALNSISVLAGDATSNYAQIGNGGHTAYGTSFGGDVSVISSTGEVIIRASDFANQAYAQVGHGGRFEDANANYASGPMSGTITVDAGTNVLIDGGGGTSYAQLGHGGFKAGQLALGSTFSGLIDVDAGGDLTIQGGDSDANSNGFALLGHGGTLSDGDGSGAIQVDVDGLISLRGGTTTTGKNSQYAQLGHGGNQRSGTLNGAIDINQNGGTGAGGITLTGGETTASYVHIGHGGRLQNGAIGQDGLSDLTVSTTGQLRIVGGSANDTYAQVGHGGERAIATVDGDITINANDIFMAGDATTGSAASQIGHGGDAFDGTVGAISANLVISTDGDVNLGGNQFAGDAHTQIGHGGFNGGTAGNTLTGNINITTQTGDLILTGADQGNGQSYVQVGHAGQQTGYGSATGTITTDIGQGGATGGIQLVGSGAQNSVMIGHGGERAEGDFSGTIDVDAQETISLAAGTNTDANVQIGHGGSGNLIGSFVSGNTIGNISVVSRAGDITVDGGTSNEGTFAQIGNGGYQNTGNHSGIIEISADGLVRVNGTGGLNRYAQIGHGGALGTGTTLDGQITLSATEVQILGGTGDGAYGQIGHGGTNHSADSSGLIYLDVLDNLTMTSNSGAGSYTQIGHGGSGAGGNLSGDISVVSQNPGGTIEMTAGGGSAAYSLIGHGDDQDDDANRAGGTRQGAIGVFADIINRTPDADTIAQIGHATAANDPALNLGGSHYQVVAYTGGNALTVDDAYRDSALISYLNNGAPVIIGGGDITVDSAFNYGSAGPLTFLATDSLTFNEEVQNAGIGNVNVVAGYNDPTRLAAPVSVAANVASTTFDVDLVRDNNLFGTSATDVLTINGASVGSQFGETNALGYAVDLNGGGAEAGQLGYFFSNPQALALGISGLGGVTPHYSAAGVTNAPDFDGGASPNPVSVSDGLTYYITFTPNEVELNGLTHVMEIGGASNGTGIYLLNGEPVFVNKTNSGESNAPDFILGSLDDTDVSNGSFAVDLNVGPLKAGEEVTLVASYNPAAGSDELTFAVLPTYSDARIETYSIAGSNPGGNWVGNQTFSVGLNDGGGSNGGLNNVGGNPLNYNGNQSLDGTVALAEFYNQFSTVALTGDQATGAINVNSRAGDITLNSGDTFAQIGHTVGRDAEINIFSESGDVVLNGGDALNERAQIGHGGTDIDVAQSGNILIQSNDVALNAGSGLQTQAHIGHGGNGADGDLFGQIMVNFDTTTGLLTTGAGEVTVTGGSLDDAFAQIGHGGTNSDGSKTGKIIVGGTDVTVSGGTGTGAYGQIGHGGLGADGDITAPMYVTATNNVQVNGGSGINAYGMIGNGDGIPVGEGDRNGDLYIEAGNTIGALGGNAPAVLGALTALGNNTSDTAINAPNYSLIGANFGGASMNLIETGGDLDIDGYLLYNSSTDLNLWATGSVNINGPVQNAGDGDINVAAGWDGATGFTGAPGTGGYLDLDYCPDFDVDFSLIKADANAWGTDAGENVNVDSTNSGIIAAVGSHSGQTNVLGYDVNVIGGTKLAQIGYLGQDMTILSGLQGVNPRFVGSGNQGATPGGISQAAGLTFLASITPDTNDLSGLVGVLEIGGGSNGTGIYLVDGVPTYVQKQNSNESTGPGAFDDVAYNDSPNANNIAVDLSTPALVAGEEVQLAVTLDPATGEVVFGVLRDDPNSVTEEFQLVGDVVGNWIGNATVSAGQTNGGGGLNQVTGNPYDFRSVASGGNVSNSTFDGRIRTSFYNDVGTFSFYEAPAVGSATGDIMVQAKNEVNLNAGIGHAQIGHDMGLGADIMVSAGDGNVNVLGGSNAPDAFAMIGHGGDALPGSVMGDLSGAISVATLNGDIVLNGGTTGDSYSQIGHGGARWDANLGSGSDTIEVEATNGAVNLLGGSGDRTYAQIGHGGLESLGDINDSIMVTQGGTDPGDSVLVQGGSGSQTYAQIGHGGAEFVGDVGQTADADITVNAEGDVQVLGGDQQEAYAMIGHGGDSTSAGTLGYTGDITVTTNSGDVLIESNRIDETSANRTFGQIGHGGYIGGVNGDLIGDITITASSGSISALAGGDGNNNYVQVGHGGVASTAINGHSGAINLSAGGDINFAAGPDSLGAGGDQRRYAMLGHGGANTDGDHSGAITVTAGTSGTGSITFDGGDAASSAEDFFAQLGHGGQNSDGNMDGAIIVTAADNITFTGGEATETYVQLGHGGMDATGDRTGSIQVTATVGNIDFTAGNENEAYAQIGHGGHSADFITGTTAAETIDVTAGGFVRLRGSLNGTSADNAAPQAYAQIGHGGQYADGSNLGTITVNAGTDVLLESGFSNQTDTHIGHGGLYNTTGTKGSHSGTIDINSGGDVILTAGQRERAFAQIGHGGYDMDGNHSGLITVDATGALNLFGGTVAGVESYAQVGHGGVGVTGTKDGDILVNVDSVTMAGQQFNGNYAQVGHGGYNSDGIIGTTSSNIVVNATDFVNLAGNQAGSNTAPTQIGHGGYNAGLATESIDGDITVTTQTGDIDLTGSNNGSALSYVQIGHAGQLSDYDATGNITVDAGQGGATGGISLTGSSAQNHVMIGHGGEEATGSFAGSIDVDAQESITILGGANTDAVAQIGHGGTDGTGTASGNISVVSDAGDITLTGGSGSTTGTLAQIGHGGLRNQGTSFGGTGEFIEVSADGLVTLTGTGNLNRYAQIGHGGYGTIGSKEADINVSGGAGVSLQAGSAAEVYAQIGHGGATATGDTFGEVNVDSATGDVSVTGGSDTNAYAQIGHGGSDGSATDRTGKISVTAAVGNITVSGSSGDGAYGQIGHGGLNDSADIDAPIYVSAGDTVAVNGGSGTNAYGMIGNGDAVPTSTGDRSGDLFVGAGVALTTSTAGAQTTIGADTAVGTNTSDTALQAPFYNLMNPNLSGQTVNLIELAGDLDVNGTFIYTSDSDLNMWATQDVNIAALVQNNGSGDINVVAGWNGTTGFTGAPGTGGLLDANNCPDFTAVFNNIKNDSASWGNGTGSVNVDSTGLTQAAAVGSYAGQTNVLGYDVNVIGDSGQAAQIGFVGPAVGGPVDLFFDGFNTEAGYSGGPTTAVQPALTNPDGLGFTVTLTPTAADLSGTTTLIELGGIFNGTGLYLVNGVPAFVSNLGNNGAQAPGAFDDLALNDAGSPNSFAVDLTTTPLTAGVEATVTAVYDPVSGQLILAVDSVGQDASLETFAIAGTAGSNNWSGDNSLSLGEASGSLTSRGGLNTVVGNVFNNTDVAASFDGAIAGAYYNEVGNLAVTNVPTGNIMVQAKNDVNVTALDGTAQIGHNAGQDSDIMISTEAGDLVLNGGTTSGSSAQVGHGGANVTDDLSGDINVDVAGLVNLNGGSTAGNAYAQLGHGGTASSGTKSGTILVNAGSVDIGSFDVDGNYAQIGHGGRVSSGNIGLVDGDSDITVNADGDILLDGNKGSSGSTATQIGHGGYDSGNNGDTIQGDITLTTQTGDVRVIGSNGGSFQSSTQVGHAGLTSDYDATGDIVVDAGQGGASGGVSIVGSGAQNHTQIGHGGERARGDYSGLIDVDAVDTISLVGGSNGDATAQIGHGGVDTAGDFSGDISVVTTTGNVTLQGGTGANGSSAQIGHGGSGSSGELGALGEMIEVMATTGDVRLTGGGGGQNRFAQIGHGGEGSSGNRQAGIDVQAGGLVFVTGGNGDNAYAQVGHGGYNATGALGNVTDAISVTGQNGVTVEGGGGTNSYAQIGLGGADDTAGDADGSRTGNITVSATNGEVSLTTNAGDNSYAQIGNGGFQDDGTKIGDVMVTSSNGGLTFMPGVGSNAYTQVGHGGAVSTGDASGVISATTSGDVSLQGGSGTTNTYALLGHGGADSSGTYGSNIDVMAGGMVSLNGGSGLNGFAQVGHGGFNATGDFGSLTQQTTVTAGSGVSLEGGDDTGSYAQIGLGGGDDTSGDADGTRVGDVTVTTTGEISLTGSSADNAYTQIGHGGFQDDSGKAGDVTVSSGNGSLAMAAGSGTNSSAQIGHGGTNSTGNISGDISASFGENVVLEGGSGSAGTYALLGHGSTGSTGNLSSNIDVQAGGLLFLGGGSGNNAYAQIGLGGYDASGNFSSSEAIKVTATNNITLQGGNGTGSYSQIGLGGADSVAGDADGTREGKIIVRSTDGGVTLNGDGGDQSYSQIGHGGYQADGNMSGGTYVFANNGNLVLNAGSGADAYNLIGHGDAAGTSTGTRMGDVWTQASGAVTINSSASSTATIGHLTNTVGGVSNGNLAIIGNTLQLGNGAGIGIASMLNGGADALLAAIGSDLVINGDILYNGTGDLDLVAGNNVRVRSRVQNRGSGDINLIGGWDGSTGLAPVNQLACPPVTGDFFNSASVLADSGSYGGQVVIGDFALSQPAAVGSYSGTTRVAANDLSVLGSNTTSGAYAQLGYSTHGTPSSPMGDLLVTLNGDLLVRGGDVAGAEALIGNGGGAGNVFGDIDIFADSATIRGGSGFQSFAQVGHSSTTRAQGDTRIVVTEDILIRGGAGSRAYAKVGHGSTQADGNYYGDIFLSAEDGVQAGSADADKNDIRLIRGTGNNAYAQIGHGDFIFSSAPSASGTGTRKGDIQVRAGSDVISDGGMIGHVDPNRSQASSSDSNVVVAVSRDQPRSILGATVRGEDIPPNDGVGRIIAKNGASFAVPSDSQLRFYVPTREGVKVEEGTQINGMSFTPVALDDPRALFESARVQVTEDGIVLIYPQVPLFLAANQDDPFFDSAFFESFVFYYDSLTANEPRALLDFLYESGFNSNADRIEDLESALDMLPESGSFRIGYRVGEDQPDPYSTWWLVALQAGDERLVEVAPDGTIYIWQMANPEGPAVGDASPENPLDDAMTGAE